MTVIPPNQTFTQQQHHHHHHRYHRHAMDPTQVPLPARPAGMSSTGAIARQFYNARLGGEGSGVSLATHGGGGGGMGRGASSFHTTNQDASAAIAAAAAVRERLRRATGAASSSSSSSGNFAGQRSEALVPVEDRLQFRYNFTRFATVGDCLTSTTEVPDLVGITSRATAALRAAYSKNRPQVGCWCWCWSVPSVRRAIG